MQDDDERQKSVGQDLGVKSNFGRNHETSLAVPRADFQKRSGQRVCMKRNLNFAVGQTEIDAAKIDRKRQRRDTCVRRYIKR